MKPEEATHSKEIRKILKEALHGNKDLNLYLGLVTDGAYSLTILSSPSGRKSVKNFEKELAEFIKKIRGNRIVHGACE
ncbi:hypothetical protein BGL78_01460 [Helicobacter pylori]|uniref:hypothetical protein n=1 Tax=Helicobacter pylori TaxID=210 RepID=UPI0009A3E8AE|nr:hypothetical protein [Helicobacter pylori]OPG66630.1 hypothetical protein BGL78_01460 [Helicobacter pylori]